MTDLPFPFPPNAPIARSVCDMPVSRAAQLRPVVLGDPGRGRAAICRPIIVGATMLLACACGRIELTDTETIVGPVSVELSGDEPYRVALDLEAGTTVLATATQGTIDVGLSVADADGDTLSVDSPGERDGNEFLFFKAAKTGRYEIVVDSLDYRQTSAETVVTVQKLASLSRGDRLRMDALRAETAAARAAFDARFAEHPALADELYLQSAGHYRRAAEKWADLAIDARRALNLYRAAVLHYFLARWSEADAAVVESLKYSANDSNQAVLYARALHLLGQIRIESLGEAEIGRARDVLLQAEALQRKLGDRYNLAITINSLGILDYEQGDLVSARDRFLDAARIQTDLGELGEASKIYNNVASIDERRGMVVEALESYDRALQLSQNAGAEYEYAVILENSADAHAILGDMEEALLRYSEAQTVAEHNGDRLGVAQALDGIGNIYYRLGNWGAAANHLEQSLKAHASETERRPLIETRLHLGNTYRSIGEYERAVAEHEIALELAGRQAEKGLAHLELGRDRFALNDIEAAYEHFHQSLRMAEATGDTTLEIAALTERGRVTAQSSPARAIEDLDRALALGRAFTPQKGQVNTLAALARAHRRNGDPTTALSYAEQALSLTRDLRSRIGNARLRYTYSGVQAPTLELVIDLLMDMHGWEGETPGTSGVDFSARALEVSDLAHATTLVELMYTAGDSVTDAAGRSLRSRHRELRQQLAQVAYLQEQAESSAIESDAESQREDVIARIAAELDVIETKIHELNPESRHVANPTRLDANGIRELLATADEKTTLLEFSLGDARSFVWAVSEQGIASFELPGRHVVERLAQQSYTQLKQPAQRRGRDAVRQLSSVLLQPVAEYLDAERIVVVPDGALHYIPFGALEIPGNHRYLVQVADVVTLPSASVLAAQRSSLPTRQQETSGIAVIADPVFDRQDIRFNDTAMPAESRLVPPAATRLGNAASLSRLPFTAQEAEAIGRIAGRSDMNLTLTGFDANRAEFLAAPLNRFRIIHMASHGLINAERPELSALALSAFNSSGQKVYNLVQLDDIYELNINADIVVLSACDTALGVNVRGEGLVGLVHAFMYAGARGVVGSLWAVQDRATARLMETFYDNLLHKNLAPPAALRHAQLAIAADRQWRDPYFWAAFVYQGEWQL